MTHSLLVRDASGLAGEGGMDEMTDAMAILLIGAGAAVGGGGSCRDRAGGGSLDSLMASCGWFAADSGASVLGDVAEYGPPAVAGDGPGTACV